jgi:hypothetical protein
MVYGVGIGWQGSLMVEVFEGMIGQEWEIRMYNGTWLEVMNDCLMIIYVDHFNRALFQLVTLVRLSALDVYDA